MNTESKTAVQGAQVVQIAPVRSLAQCEQLAQDFAALRLSFADELVREAWRLMDGQDPKTADWHRAASAYFCHSKAAVHADTARLDLYERQNNQEGGLVPYYDDAVGKWFVPPTDDDLGDGKTFESLREALDWMLSEGLADEQ